MKAILDAGPLIAAWNPDDSHHEWAKNLFKKFTGPFFTTEPVLTEVAHVTGQDALIVEGVRSGKFIVAGNIQQDASAMARALAVYPDCDLADASLIALSERRPSVHVLTTDKRHFVKYRRADKLAIPLETP
jgi:predicted nucleic acid-binding protein